MLAKAKGCYVSVLILVKIVTLDNLTMKRMFIFPGKWDCMVALRGTIKTKFALFRILANPIEQALV
jgi:hypothetical protein